MAYGSILFVDDDVLTQWVMTEALTKAGYEVTSVCHCADAVAMLSADAEFDLLLTEIDLPEGADGVRLGEHWGRTLLRRPVIYTGVTAGLALGRLGSRDIFLEKPFSSGRLLRTIGSAIADAHYLPMSSFSPRRCSHVH